MIIQIDGRVLAVPPHIEKQVVDSLCEMLVGKLYPAIPQPLRIGMMIYSRSKIRAAEVALNAAGYDGKQIRPPPGADPNLHFMNIMLAESLREMADATLAITTEQGTDTIATVQLQPVGESQGG